MIRTALGRVISVSASQPVKAFFPILVMVSGKWSLVRFVWRYGNHHASPNSGYPEAALAGILNCRFGGPHTYFGEIVYKPYIGEHDRELMTDDMKKAVRVNRTAEILMLMIVLAYSYLNGF